MNTNEITTSRVTVALAVVGFIALTGGSLWLAAYSTKFVPDIVGRIGSAAVYLGSVFVPSPEPSLSVVPATIASTTIPFEEEATTTPASSTPNTSSISPVATQQNWVSGKPVAVTNGIVSSSTPPAPRYFGLPDLQVKINTVGYSVSTSSLPVDEINATTTIPSHTRIAVKFTVTNIGTNITGPWAMNISIPSSGGTVSQTFLQDSLIPTQPSVYVANLVDVSPGSGRIITVTVDPNHLLTESSITNNIATSTNITVLGS